MKVSGERRFEAPRATVWQVLNDPAQMAKTMPGVESFEIQDDRHWRAHVKIPLGLGGRRMSIDVEKISPATVATSALDALEADEPEAFADDFSRAVKAGLSHDQDRLYPQIERQFLELTGAATATT